MQQPESMPSSSRLVYRPRVVRETVVCVKPRSSPLRIELIMRLLRRGMVLTKAERAAAKEDRLYSIVAYRSATRRSSNGRS